MDRKKAKFIVIGYGWRADFFYRIAKALPEEFEIVAAVLRTPERAAQVGREQGFYAVAELEKALAAGPDFAVLCVPRTAVKDYLVRLMEWGIPVLCETPPGQNVEELNELWREKERYGGNVQVVEQYFLQPLYAGMLQICGSGLLGRVSNMTLSALHGYHAVSIFRKVLNVGMENCRISGRRFSFPVTATNSRQGITTRGQMVNADRDLAVLEFESGRTAFLDFSGEQYFSLIRSRRWNIQGDRGEINDLAVRYLSDRNEAFTARLHRIDEGVYNNSGWYHRGIQFRDSFIYTNPFPGARLNDDEIAVADCLRRMADCVRGGAEVYPLREALQDTYLSFLMEQAVEQGTAAVSAPQAFSR